jgi:hypothetical protein
MARKLPDTSGLERPDTNREGRLLRACLRKYGEVAQLVRAHDS